MGLFLENPLTGLNLEIAGKCCMGLFPGLSAGIHGVVFEILAWCVFIGGKFSGVCKADCCFAAYRTAYFSPAYRPCQESCGRIIPCRF